MDKIAQISSAFESRVRAGLM